MTSFTRIRQDLLKPFVALICEVRGFSPILSLHQTLSKETTSDVSVKGINE